jgi:hypothetical protein
MPIRITCSCGKALSVRDELAGKAVKCPGCQTTLRVPAAPAAAPSAATAKAARPSTGAAAKAAAAKPVSGKPTPGKPTPGKPATGKPAPPAPAAKAVQPLAPAASSAMDDLFNEAGFELRTGKTCPNCFAAMAADAVLCTACGLHLESGTKLKRHATEFVDEDSGEAYLQRAAADMERARKMDEKMAKGAGLPWWMLGLILFLLASTTGVAVIAVNVAKRGDDSDVSFDAVTTMMLLAAVASSVLGIGAQAVVIYRACMESVKQGLLALFLPGYVLYYGFTRFSEVGMTQILAILAGSTGIGLFIAATMNQG